MKTKEEFKAEKFMKKYKFFGCNLDVGINNGVYKGWDVTFLLLTKKEKERLIKQTYRRMQTYNQKYKLENCAGYTNNKGEDI